MDGVLDAFACHVAERPRAAALTEGGRTLDYAGLAAAIDRTAYWMEGLGLGPGDMLGWLGVIGAPRIVALVAAQKLGVCFVSPDPRLPDASLAAIFQTAGVTRLAGFGCDPGQAAQLGLPRAELAPDPFTSDPPPPPFPRRALDPELPSHLRFTSGSTGIPKILLYTRRMEGGLTGKASSTAI